MGPSPRLLAALAVFVLGVVGGGYAWLGAPRHLDLGPAASVALGTAEPPQRAASAPDRLSPEQVLALAERLERQLQGQPDDASSWALLARAHAALGRRAQAAAALEQAARRRPHDAGLLTDHADFLARLNGPSLQGEPTRLIERALALDPTHAKALALAGAAAYDRQDFEAAARYWERLAEVERRNEPLYRQIRERVDQARRLAASPARVGVTVTLTPALQGSVGPNDILFIFARAADARPGTPPLAVLRKRARDLPISVTLDDSLAMSPTAKLSDASRVLVVARISKSGSATPRSGDLQSHAEPVAVGASGVRLEIDARVAP
ncbi:tetratricopeptide repeat protein [Caldimonas brevitalea]|uniref:tetratricopeptide repeat protein n=1 Tax=Caldimonas brevitalea TaxID=413882 RepID=UPI0012FB14AA|nr:c-type cytochrome biogenesis protein CcmI [Caldimonas brevitalea]